MKSSIHTRLFYTVLASAVAVLHVSAVCPAGNIGIGIQVEPFNIMGARAERAVIVGNDCTIKDGKGINDANICGSYGDGSTVDCADGTTPNSVHTSDGEDWGNCTPSTEDCTSASGGITGNETIHVHFCCEPTA